MTYKERFAKAAETKTLKTLTPQWVAFDEPGKSVCGVLLGTNETSSSLGVGTYLQYLMRTDDGLVKFSLGASTDKELRLVLREKGLYRITYIGQQKIKGGRRVNRFDVEELEDESEPQPADSDVPF